MTSGTPNSGSTKPGIKPQSDQALENPTSQASDIFLSVVIPAYNESTRLPDSLE
jgi:hypothetical protein